jgi:hypothetical protein
MRIFNVILGRTKTEFSVWEMNGKYQGRVNDIVIYESSDYEAIRTEILFDLGSNYIHDFQTLN